MKSYPNLGITQDFLIGGEISRSKVYSLSLFLLDNNSALKYQRYTKLCVDSLLAQNPDWGVHLYIDKSVSNRFVQKAFGSYPPGLQVIRVQMHRYPDNYGLLPVLFRYLPLFDPGIEVCVFRDIDNIWTDQDRYFVDTWLSSDCALIAALNDKYLRQQIRNAQFEYEERYYSCIFAGLWGVRKQAPIPVALWQLMFAYLEFSTDFIPSRQNRFYYGFDEILLSRICVPYFLSKEYKCLAYPVRIYDEVLLRNMTNPLLVPAGTLRNEMRKLITSFNLPYSSYKADADQQIAQVRDILVNRYWEITGESAGEAQYALVVLSHLYFYILTGNVTKYNRRFMTALRYLIYPIPTVISCGIFTFNNVYLSQWPFIKAQVQQYFDTPALIPMPPPYEPDIGTDEPGSAL